MRISSADLLGTAAIAARIAADTADKVRANDTTGNLENLRYAEGKLAQALAEVRAARWGVERRMPQFDARDLDLLLEREVLAIHAGRDCIPAPTA